MAVVWNSVWWLLSAAFLAVGLLLRIRTKSRRPLPPGPALSWPFLGNLPSMTAYPHQDFSKMVQTYGPVALCKLGKFPAVIVASAESAHELLTSKDTLFADRFQMLALGETTFNFSGIAFGPYQEHTLLLRKILNTHFMTRSRIKSYEHTRREDATAMVRSIHEDLAAQGGQGVVSVRPRLMAFILNNTTQMLCRRRFLGPVLDGDNDATTKKDMMSAVQGKKWVALVATVLKLGGTFNIADYVPALRWLDPQGILQQAKVMRDELDAFLSELVREHKQFHDSNPHLIHSKEYVKDFLDVLLLLEGDEKVSDVNIKAAMMDLLLGSSDTSQVSMEWALALLLRNPKTMQRLQEEMDAVVGRDRLLEESDLPNLPYLHAVVKEAFRVIPPVPVSLPRYNTVETELAGYRIPAGTCVFLHIQAIGLDPKVWHNPLGFDPDRFMGMQAETNKDYFNLLTFGSGRRACPAKSLATLITSYGLGLLVQAFDWAPPPGQTPKDIDMTEDPGLIYCKKIPLCPTAKLRLHPQAYLCHQTE